MRSGRPRAASCPPTAAVRVGAHRPAPGRTAAALQGIILANSAEPLFLFKAGYLPCVPSVRHLCSCPPLSSTSTSWGLGFPSKILPVKLKQEAPSGRPGFCAIFLASPEQPGMGKAEHLLNLISCFDFHTELPWALRLSASQPFRSFTASGPCLYAFGLCHRSLVLAPCRLRVGGQ